MEFDPSDEFINKHMPFIVKTVADYTNRYVEIENSEELSIALEAFYDAMNNFKEEKGNFYSYSKKVITNRLIDNSRKNNKILTVSFDMADVPDNQSFEEDSILRQELEYYEKQLALFSIDFEMLFKYSPKHKESRNNVFKLASDLAKDEDIVDRLFATKRLPITEIITKYNFSKKVLKRHKFTIISIIIAYKYNVSSVIQKIE